MGKSVKLSQCMIVKNEEKNIEKALSWGKGIVCEQIVVDTGSTDRTVEIAERMGAKVFRYEWQDDFSAAKNYAIEKTGGDWVAFLDADEFFTESDAGKIIPLLNKVEAMPSRERFHAVKCALFNLNDTGEVFSSMSQTRLFRNGSVYYGNKIHEQLCPKNAKDFRFLNVGNELIIYHTGYAPGIYRTTDKVERNTSMIRKVLRDEPENWDYWSYLGDCLFVLGEHGEAVDAYEKVLGHMEAVLNPSRIDTAFINLVRIIIGQPGEEAKRKLQDLYEVFGRSGSNCPDVDYWMGLYFMSQGDKPRGCLHFERTLANLDNYGRGASLAASGELKLIYSMLEHAHSELGNPPAAVKYGVLALRLDKYQKNELKTLIALLKDEAVADVIGFLEKIYSFTLLKDKLFLIRAAKEAGADALEHEFYQLLPPDEQCWLDRKAESPYALLSGERAERYPLVSCRNGIDTRFLELLEEIRGEGQEFLVRQLKEGLDNFKGQQGNYQTFLSCFSRYGCWGRLIPENGIYEAFEKRVSSLKDNWESFLWLYGRLGDYRSKQVIAAILDNWLHLDFLPLSRVVENGPYFLDMDLIPSAEDMVYLDISTTDFQTVWDFIQAYGETYQDIYCYTEEIPEGGQLPRRILSYKNVTILTEMPHGTPATADGPLLIKLDVGAGLMTVLDSYQGLIARSRPTLAMCVDEGYEDIWAAARRIHGIDPSYRFCLRYYGGNLIPTKYVLFAL